MDGRRAREAFGTTIEVDTGQTVVSGGPYRAYRTKINCSPGAFGDRVGRTRARSGAPSDGG
jgi:hypothetical protein